MSAKENQYLSFSRFFSRKFLILGGRFIVNLIKTLESSSAFRIFKDNALRAIRSAVDCTVANYLVIDFPSIKGCSRAQPSLSIIILRFV